MPKPNACPNNRIVISGNTPNPTVISKASAKLKNLRVKLPMNAVDTVAAVRKIRDEVAEIESLCSRRKCLVLGCVIPSNEGDKYSIPLFDWVTKKAPELFVPLHFDFQFIPQWLAQHLPGLTTLLDAHLREACLCVVDACPSPDIGLGRILPAP